MKTIEKTRKWLLKNRVDKDGDLDLRYLDFSDFDGDVYIGGMKVKGNLEQSRQQVKENLFQYDQKVQKNLFQDGQQVKGNLYQCCQKVQGEFITQTLNDDEKYEIDEDDYTCIVKKTKKEIKENE